MSSRLDELFEGLPPQLDVQDVARVLGTSTKGVYRWLQSGVIPAYKLGSTWIIFRDELKDTLIASSNLSQRTAEAGTDHDHPADPARPESSAP